MASLDYFFEDRKDAGKQLAGELKKLNFENPVLLALPRGGIVVADEVAEELHVPLDVVIARKIGAPGHSEYGIGAISENEEPTFNSSAISYFNPESPAVRQTVEEETNELHRRKQLYRGGQDLPEMKDKTVIVIDDGLATGVTAVAAAKFLRTLGPKELVLAVPVGPAIPGREVEESYDRIICLHSLQDLRGVGLWYNDFTQVEDEEVLDILKKYH
ncbi:MAG: phosphoribosyltransferase [Bacteriovoracia bacterium]